MTPTERRQRITDVCEAARGLRPEERESFVEGQCGGDEQLLQEVKSALSEYGQTDRTADTIALVVSEAPPVPPRPKRIGRYEITGDIGSGGSGQVYSALDRNVGRVVAIKVLNAPGDADLVRRFQAEAKTVANLHHKNIVTVHEYGEENGVPYLVMEYLNGTTLQELIRRRSLSLLDKLEIMSEVAEGLQYAHECGITHRDVKPANIMLLTDGSVKIMDFGIARLGAEGATRLTQTGLLIGSIMYMAPEQFGGTADALTDVFSYGVTFYELLTGKNPFAAADPVVIIFRIANTDPPPVRSVAPECPAALDQIIARTLARDREERYSNFWDVLADTRGILSDLRRDEGYKLYTEAARLFDAGQLDAAKVAVRKVLDLDPAQEDARKLRSEIEEALRQRDAALRAQALMDQAEKAVQEQQYEGAGAILDSIRDLGVVDPKLQGRLDWAAAQVEEARRRERNLNEARRNVRVGDLTAAFRSVSEVLASDPGHQPGKDLLQEIRNQMAADEARRRLQEEAARAEGLLLAGETDQALFVLAEMERLNPEFQEAAILRARAEAQKAQEVRARRFSEGTAEVNDLLKNGLFDQAVTRIDDLAIDVPDGDSPENHELQALRKQASERPSAEALRREQIARLAAEAEALIARREFDKAIHLLETALAELGDDFDLTRLLLQAAVAGNAAWEQAGAERGPSTPVEAAPEDAQDGEALEHWRQAIGKLDEVLGPPPPPALATERDLPLVTESQLPPASRAHDQREGAIREAPPRPRNRAVTILIVLDVIALSIVILLLLVRPHFSFFTPKDRSASSGVKKLSVDEPSGSRTLVRGKDFLLDLRASGSSLPLSWEITEGSLPPGLSLNSTTGRIAGAPVKNGMYMFLAKTADGAGQSAQRVITLEVVEPPASNAPESAGGKSSENSVHATSGGDLKKEHTTGAVASNPPSCPSNAFNLAQYGDLLMGELVWTGTLSAGGRLDVRNLHASTGSVQGDILPRGVPVRLTTVTPGGILVVMAPSARNCWDTHLVLHNMGSQRSEIRIKWEVFQP